MKADSTITGNIVLVPENDGERFILGLLVGVPLVMIKNGYGGSLGVDKLTDVLIKRAESEAEHA